MVKAIFPINTEILCQRTCLQCFVKIDVSVLLPSHRTLTQKQIFFSIIRKQEDIAHSFISKRNFFCIQRLCQQPLAQLMSLFYCQHVLTEQQFHGAWEAMTSTHHFFWFTKSRAGLYFEHDGEIVKVTDQTTVPSQMFSIQTLFYCRQYRQNITYVFFWTVAV